MGMLVILCLVLAMCHSAVTVAEGNISFNTAEFTGDRYIEFINELRAQLTTGGSTTMFDIPVLKSSAPDSRRFVLVDLTLGGHSNITLAIDVLSVNVVAYSTTNQGKSYFFRDAPIAALNTLLFPETTGYLLPFTGNYFELESAAGKSREEIHLGRVPLNYAIAYLYVDSSKAESLLVIMQMVSEAARFKFIEQRARSCMSEKGFLPDPEMLSLEDNWSPLSFEIQRSLNGVFNRIIELRGQRNNSVLVYGTRSNIILGVKLLHYQCNTFNTPTRSSVAGAEYENQMCTVLNSTTRISGPSGLCVDANDDIDGSVTQLWSCGQELSKQWTFQTDGTIRANGKCMTISSDKPGKYVMKYDCDKANSKATKWVLSTDGTITNPHSGLVLTAHGAENGTSLTTETNVYAATQGWKAGDDVEPTVTSIEGYNGLCLESYNHDTLLWIQNCIDNKLEQQWALYSDGTIRVNNDHSRCITSHGQSSEEPIIIRECEGSVNQRWVFKYDGTILNPNATLVMDVRDGDPSLEQIILYPRYGNPYQQWVSFFSVHGCHASVEKKLSITTLFTSHKRSIYIA